MYLLTCFTAACFDGSKRKSKKEKKMRYIMASQESHKSAKDTRYTAIGGDKSRV